MLPNAVLRQRLLCSTRSLLCDRLCHWLFDGMRCRWLRRHHGTATSNK